MVDRAKDASPERLAEQTASERYRELQGEVLGTVRRKLAARRMDLDASDLEEAYILAWHGVYETMRRGEEVVNLKAMLVTYTWRRAVDAYRELHVGRRAEFEEQSHGALFDVDQQLDDAAKIKRFIARLRDRLSAKECHAVSLCLIHGYTRAEAAELMGLTRAQMERVMDGATKKIGGVVASIEARGCGSEEWSRLLRDYALGLIAEEHPDHARAAAHVAECGACRRYVNGLRGLAVLVPPVLPLGVASAGHGAGILAYLARLIRGAHSGAAEALKGGSSSPLAGGLSTGAVAKGVAVIAVGATAAALATQGSHHHRPATHRAPAAQLQARAPAEGTPAATLGPARSSAPSRTFSGATHHAAPARRAHAAHRRHSLVPAGSAAAAPSSSSSASQSQVSSEFGIEGARASAPEPAPRPAPSEGAQAASVGREFGFEH